jgi:hypothetical protein
MNGNQVEDMTEVIVNYGTCRAFLSTLTLCISLYLYLCSSIYLYLCLYLSFSAEHVWLTIN